MHRTLTATLVAALTIVALAPAVQHVRVSPSGDGDVDVWLALAAGVAATGLVGGTAAALSRRRRVTV
jgi:hypothetical protein